MSASFQAVSLRLLSSISAPLTCGLATPGAVSPPNLPLADPLPGPPDPNDPEQPLPGSSSSPAHGGGDGVPVEERVSVLAKRDPFAPCDDRAAPHSRWLPPRSWTSQPPDGEEKDVIYEPQQSVPLSQQTVPSLAAGLYLINSIATCLQSPRLSPWRREIHHPQRLGAS